MTDRVPLDPQAAAVVAERNAQPAGDLEAMRARYVWGTRRFGLPPADLDTVEDLVIPGPGGHSIPARVFRPHTPSGCIVWLHGGGWVLGSLDGVAPLAGALAAASGATVLAVDYRLAPEHPFPAGLDDAEAAVTWALGPGADALGHDAVRVIVGGDSSGGNLAAVAARRVRDAGATPPLRAQLLAYPVTDASMSTPSYATPAATTTAEGLRTFWELYLGGAALDPTDPDLSPVAATLEGLPPTLLVVAGHDVLYDDGLAYAAALRAAGVEVEVAEYPSLPHGFLDWTGAIEAGRSALDVLGRFVQDHVRRDP